MSCYKSHLSILQENTSSSISWAALEHDINTWKQQLQSCEDTLTIALFTAVLHVAMELLQERVLLLPQACTVFFSKYGAVSNPSQLYLEVGDSEVQFSSRWLLHQLIVYLHSYMRYKCIHKRFGVICTEMVAIFYKACPGHLEANVTHIQQRMSVKHVELHAHIKTAQKRAKGDPTSSHNHQQPNSWGSKETDRETQGDWPQVPQYWLPN